jgi:hypothetical protein
MPEPSPSHRGQQMVASNDTVTKIYWVIRKHCTDSQIKAIIKDLIDVPGNQSFRDTIIRLQERHEHRSKDEKKIDSDRRKETET